MNTLEQLQSKVSKSIGMLQKLSNRLLRFSLTTIYKSIVRPHVDYGDVIFDKVYNNSFQQRLESLQCKALLAITGAIKGSSIARLYQELGPESLQNRGWFRKLSVFYKIVKEQSPEYLYDLIPSSNISYQTRNSRNLVIPQFKIRNNFFLNSFFPSALVEWNKLDWDIRNSPSYSTFKKKISNFIRPRSNDVFKVSHPKRLIFLTRLRVGLSHLTEHKFKHSFLDTLNPICTCGFDIKILNHFFLHYSRFTNERKSLLLNIEKIIPDISRKTDTSITSILFYGDPSFSAELNTNMLNLSIDYILSTKKFESTLFTET